VSLNPRGRTGRLILILTVVGLLLAISVAPVSAETGSITIGNGGADGEIGNTFSSINGAPWQWDGQCYGDVGTAYFVDVGWWVEARTALEFPLTGLPADATITSATLSLSHSVGSASDTIAIYGYAGDGTHDAGDVLVAGTPIVFSSAAPVIDHHDVTALLTPAVVAAGWAGFSLRAEPPILTDLGSAHAFECPQMLHFPVLTIEYFREDPPDEDLDGVIDAIDVCPGTVADNFPQLMDNRYSYDGTALVSGLSSNQARTIQDTGGCSASQIIAAMGLGGSHERFGLLRSKLEAWIASLL
jgi:hypothetical protein